MAARVRQGLVDTSDKLRPAFSGMKAADAQVAALTADVQGQSLSEGSSRLKQAATMAKTQADLVLRAAKVAKAAAATVERMSAAAQAAKERASKAAKAAAQATQAAAQAAEAAEAAQVAADKEAATAAAMEEAMATSVSKEATQSSGGGYSNMEERAAKASSGAAVQPGVAVGELSSLAKQAKRELEGKGKSPGRHVAADKKEKSSAEQAPKRHRGASVPASGGGSAGGAAAAAASAPFAEKLDGRNLEGTGTPSRRWISWTPGNRATPKVRRSNR